MCRHASVKARSRGQDSGLLMNCGVLVTLNIALTTSMPGTMMTAEVRMMKDRMESEGQPEGPSKGEGEPDSQERADVRGKGLGNAPAEWRSNQAAYSASESPRTGQNFQGPAWRAGQPARAGGWQLRPRHLTGSVRFRHIRPPFAHARPRSSITLLLRAFET